MATLSSYEHRNTHRHGTKKHSVRNRPHLSREQMKAEKEQKIVCHMHKATGLAIDDLTFALRRFLPDLNRDKVWRILKNAGLINR